MPPASVDAADEVDDALAVDVERIAGADVAVLVEVPFERVADALETRRDRALHIGHRPLLRSLECLPSQGTSRVET